MKPYVEFKKYSAADMVDGIPQELNNELDGPAKLAMLDPYCMLFPYGDVTQKPLWCMRHANTNGFRFGTFMSPGDGYLSLQTGYHEHEIPQKGTPMDHPYRLNNENPLEYRLSNENPKCDIRLYEDCLTWKEGDFFDVKAIPFPFTVIDHTDVFPTLSQFMQPAIYSGFYEGKPMLGMGNYDRIYLPVKSKDIGDNLAYYLAYGHGIRKDGRLETYLVCFHENGTNCGWYWIEGTEPVYSDNVEMIADWVHLPYVDDGTCTYENAEFRFAGKTIHFIGKWGSKGLTPYPRFERHGQSEIFGTWYEGEEPYEHQLFFTLNENMDAYDYKLKKLGFNVID